MKDEHEAITIKYGTYSKRFLAFLIISIFLSIMRTILGIGDLVFFSVTFLGWLTGVFYLGIMESSSKQSSYGKRVMNLKVCNEKAKK
ncbi:RDD family protein [Bizionia gelidisalsuginis]|uniref:RDD family protein n=1 Tax=Bizionia gelidisalsuginis TaxID=291188 RepID=A0ABY3MBA8_9FLAO|nr:RDD family protein [Bizionia gelidisalsuginis]TYC13559.1 RDD family protein [Bizionia gelidisalsuginis]